MRLPSKPSSVLIVIESVVLLLMLAGLSPRLSPVLETVETKIKQTVDGTSDSDQSGDLTSGSSKSGDSKKDYIKWVDFDVSCEAMKQAFRYDVDTFQAPVHLDWIQLLAYMGAKYGGDFSHYKTKDMDAIAERLTAGETMEDITSDMKYYSYYLEAYTAVLGGLVGEFQAEIPMEQAPAWALPAVGGSGGSNSSDSLGSPDDSGSSNSSSSSDNSGSDSLDGSGSPGSSETPGNSGAPDSSTPPVSDGCVWVTKYGLKAFSPIAKNYPYNDFDDFGVARSYGFKRQHLGHDMMGQVGTPVIAVESGYVEAIGWNQYGGWRLGIRSFDKRRYYYYAHLRKNYPYHKSLKEGSIVQAGDVIGYLGRTGYSATENTNNIDEPHLHFGLQLIFDESQKEGNNEIWINCYELIKFLAMNRSETVKNPDTKEYYRVYQMKDPATPGTVPEQRYQP